MSVLLDNESRVIIQGFGRAGQLQARISQEYGTNVVAGVTPGKGGTDFTNIPIYNTVREAVDIEGGNVSLIFVPAAAAAGRPPRAAGRTPPRPPASATPAATPRHRPAPQIAVRGLRYGPTGMRRS